MRVGSVVPAAMLLLAVTAQGDTPPALAGARQRIEASDFRASGRLVRVDANGSRVSDPITIEAHWFPGVLRELVEISPSRKSAGTTDVDPRVRILLEMRPTGQSTIRIFRPHQAEPAPLPFDQWSEGVDNSDFDYEDFLDAEYYWPGQTLLRTAKLGARDCDVMKSTPGGADRSHYAEVQTWLDQTTDYPVYVEKTLKSGGIVKEFTSLGLSKSGGVAYARQIEVKVHGRAGSTVLLVERGSAKANLTMKDFSSEKISHF